MFRRSGSSSRISSKRPSANNILRKRMITPFWKPHKSKHLSRKGSVLSWDEASYECQNMQNISMNIDRISTAIEYLSSSSNDQSLNNEDECLENQSRYSVPMEMDQQVQVTEEQNMSDHCHQKDDNIVDRYSIIDEDGQNNYVEVDDDCENSTLFGSLGNDSFTSDTALRDEINIEREKIKLSYMIANESNATKQSFFNLSACFGHISTNSRKFAPGSPTKHIHSMRYNK